MSSDQDTCYSRYGELRTVVQVSPDVYLVEGKSPWLRVGGDEKQVTMVDPSGGPFLHIGDEFLTDNTKKKYGYISELKVMDADPGMFKIQVRCQPKQIEPFISDIGWGKGKDE